MPIDLEFSGGNVHHGDQSPHASQKVFLFANLVAGDATNGQPDLGYPNHDDTTDANS